MRRMKFRCYDSYRVSKRIQRVQRFLDTFWPWKSDLLRWILNLFSFAAFEFFENLPNLVVMFHQELYRMNVLLISLEDSILNSPLSSISRTLIHSHYRSIPFLNESNAQPIAQGYPNIFFLSFC